MPTLVVSITLFVLALLIGIEVIGKVPATLHTPLMSGANSIHGSATPPMNTNRTAAPP